MLLTLFALFTLQRARRGHPVTPPCLHNCALSAQFYTQPWEPPLHCTRSLHSISTKTWCAYPHFSTACGRVYDEWQSNVALQYLSHPCSRFGLSFILLLTALTVLTKKPVSKNIYCEDLMFGTPFLTFISDLSKNEIMQERVCRKF